MDTKLSKKGMLTGRHLKCSFQYCLVNTVVIACAILGAQRKVGHGKKKDTDESGKTSEEEMMPKG